MSVTAILISCVLSSSTGESIGDCSLEKEFQTQEECLKLLENKAVSKSLQGKIKVYNCIAPPSQSKDVTTL